MHLSVESTKRGIVALTFDYKVRDRSGSLVEGQLEGDSMALVVRRLREMGYMPISVTPKSTVNLKTEIKIPGISDRVKLREVAVITRQLSTMVDSGLSVVRSLGILAAQVGEPGAGPGAQRGSAGPRARIVAVGGVRQAPQGVLAPVLHAGPSRRDRRKSRRGPRWPGQHHREAGPAQSDDPVGHDLSGRGASASCWSSSRR